MHKVVALGDINVDIIAQFAEFPVQGEDAFAHSTEFHCGGSAANTAKALAWLGIQTALIGRIGLDPWASTALNDLSRAGVHLDSLQRDPTVMTGLMYIIVTPDGERTIVGHRGANVFTDPDEIREEGFRKARLFLLSGYALLAEPQRSAALWALEMARRHGLTVALDPGMCVSAAAVSEMRARLPTVDILLPNLGEARQLCDVTAPEDCARALLGAGVQVVALKLGRDGCLVSSDDGLWRMPGFAVETRDSTGAGDSFAAGLIAGFLDGLDWPSAAVLANALGALAASRIGAGTGRPEAREGQALLRDHYDQPAHGPCRQAMDRTVDYIRTLTKEPNMEGKPW